MKITSDMVDPELLPIGKLSDFIYRMHSINGFRRRASLSRLMKFIPAMGAQREYVLIPRSNVGSYLRLCVIKPLVPVKKAPGLLWLHGGGYAIGAAEMALMNMPRLLMEATGCVIVAPEYRLSVEAPYPAALEDAYDALLWMKENAKELGIDDNRLVVGGESGGGGLAVGLCLLARDRKEVAISFQVPLYPMLDDRMKTESAGFENAFVWDKISNGIAWQMYLGDLYGRDDIPPYASPARETNFSGLPPAVSFVGELELFRDETIAYFDNLQQAGVRADIKVFPGCYHAFDVIKPRASVSRIAASFVLDKFRQAMT